MASFQQALQAAGWIVGRNLRIDYRWGTGEAERYRQAAVELLALAPDVVLASGAATLAMQRASRTIPFVSKAIGVSLAAIAARVMLGETLDEIGFTSEIIPSYVAVKEAVFPFTKFREFDPILGPEMRSTGEVMGISTSFGSAFGKAPVHEDSPRGH